jgi:membrane-anchored protein YejM (alkaline phosphatase superfamily)
MTASPRRRLLRWGSWFSVVNAALMAVIGLRYLPYASATAWWYVLVATLGHWAALAYIPFVAVLVPLILIAPRRRLVIGAGVTIAAAGLSLLLLDSLVFAENRHHLNPLTLSLLAPPTWRFAAVYLLVFLVIDAVIGVSLWRRCARPVWPPLGRYLAGALGCCFVASHLVHAWADARYYVPVTTFGHTLPLYVGLEAVDTLTGLGLVDRQRALERGLAGRLGRAPVGALDYPRAQLRCDRPSPLLNVVLIVVDAMRADLLTSRTAPNLSAFSKQAISFESHWSGGNSSRAGMFSLFYGLPSNYWEAFARAARPPLLMDTFHDHDYQLGLFVSANVTDAVGLERTVLARVPNPRLRTLAPRRGAHERDLVVSEQWREWLDRRDPAQPFFGFLYYDAVQSGTFPPDYATRFVAPAGASKQERRHAAYGTAMHFVDGLVGGTLADLDRRGLLDRTVVIVTSDHGMEFGENGQGFTGHGTSYSGYQMHVPLLLRWPGRPPARLTHRTSHHDIAPTLMTGVFGCTNPPDDYSSGHDLFSGAGWNWLVAGSYGDFALIEPERITIAYPSGYYEFRDRDYRLIARPEHIDEVLRAALREMSRFYR